MTEKVSGIFDLYWTIAILQELLTEGKLTPGEFKNLVESLIEGIWKCEK